jgi:dipeptide/tripeptide permease
MGILFTGYLTAVSFALELMYGMKNNSDLIGKASLAECAVLLSLMVGYFVFLLLKPEFFGEFTDEFKKDRLSSKYYNYMLFERLLVGSCLVFMLAANIGAVVPLAVLILTGIFIAVRKPYRENYHSYRAAANMAIAAIVMGVYLFYALTAAENRNSGIFLYLPLIVCGLLVVCVIYNAGAIIYGIYKMCKTKSDNNKLD